MEIIFTSITMLVGYIGMFIVGFSYQSIRVSNYKLKILKELQKQLDGHALTETENIKVQIILDMLKGMGELTRPPFTKP